MAHPRRDGPFEIGGGLPLPRRLLAIFAVSAGTVLLTMDASIATVALPTIARDLGTHASASVLIVATYNLVLAMTLLPFAAFGVRVGLRRLFLTGLAVYVCGGGLCWFAGSLPLLCAARAVQALGAAAALSVSAALVRAIYPPWQLGRGLGLNTLAGAVGAALAPALGGLLVALGSWHWVFTAGVPLALAALVGGRALPDSVRRAEPLDGLGAALCAATFGLVIAGLESANEGHNLLVSSSLVVGGLVMAIIFVRHELGEARPVLPVDLLARPALALSVAAGYCGYLASTCLLLSLPFRLQVYGFSAGETGAILVPYALTTTVIAPVSGMLSDRISPMLLGTFGSSVAAVALISLAYLPVHPSHFDFGWRLVLCGAGFAMFMPPNARLIVGSVPPDRAAPAASLISTTRMIGQACGSTLVGALLAANLGASDASALVASGLAAAATGLSAARLRWPVATQSR